MTAAPSLPEIKIDPHASADEARAYLERDRLMAAYALADIDQPEIEGTRWWIARREGEIAAVVLVVEGLPFRPCFATGGADALATLFREAIREPRVLLATPPRCRPAIEATYRFERVDHMKRMAVNVRRFRPRLAHQVTRLGAQDLDAVIDLYGHASRTYFTPERMRREIYFGVYQGNTLLAAAGTHVRSTRSGIAAVGNVLTRLAYRGRGMATTCTSAVTEAALEEHPDVVLNVRQDNAPAIAVYERLGYLTHGTFVEGPAVRRAAWERLFGALKEKK
ncbi:MAG TPA: GNAT family N-acetyltransferase [Candidatus Limnocylindria bacterium]|jgi:ribosomal protein S18 acetylase RimI-like enzyme|nr:GNAT family N-acetyltransferase [Candidatus Limnocylindria bacterium]